MAMSTATVTEQVDSYRQIADYAINIYPRFGYHIFPVVPRGKEPLVKWQDLATTDETQIRTWWDIWPDANIGINCGKSGLVVLDIDPRNGGWESYDTLPPLPGTGIVKTGSGGVHLYFEGMKRKFKLLPGLDVQGDGGYVVAPPSIHPCGEPYQWVEASWVNDFPKWPESLNPVEKPYIPTEAVTFTGDVTAYVRAAVRGELERLQQARNGSRNETLNRAAFSLGQLVGAGLLLEKEAVGVLTQAGLGIGLSPTEVNKTVNSGITSGKLQPRRVTR